MSVRIGINGFGRMGRALVRIAVAEGSPLDVVAVNDLAPADQLAKLLARDSVYGRFPQEVVLEGSQLTLGSARVQLLAEPEVKLLPWGDLDLDVVVEATGSSVGSHRRAPSTDSVPLPRNAGQRPRRSCGRGENAGQRRQQFHRSCGPAMANCGTPT